MTYQQARTLLQARQKQLERKLKHAFDFSSAKETNEFMQLVLKAAGNAQRRARTRGFDGWLYKTTEVQLKYIEGFYSKGKTFTARIYTIAALELVIDLSVTGVSEEVFALIENAAGDNVTVDYAGGTSIYADKLSRLLNWERKYDKAFWKYCADELKRNRDAKPSATYDWYQRADAEAEEAKQRAKWNEYWNAYSSSANDWFWQQQPGSAWSWSGTTTSQQPKYDSYLEAIACKGEAALNGKRWFEVLNVPQTATIAQVKEARNRLLKENHPDKGGSNDVAAAINAAYRVAEKVLH
jgi:hypothetical protein